MSAREDDKHFLSLRSQWDLQEGVSYLNHGSFGPTPRVVQHARDEWQRALARNPMDFFVRQMEGLLHSAAERLGQFVGASADDLVFVDNATAGMNVVAATVALQPGDEVLLTDHEYGAVRRIWERAALRQGAHVVIRKLPLPLESIEATVDAFFAGVSPRTRLIVVSHITSPTAVILPVEEICRQAKERGIPVCIDGPHALAIESLDLERLECEYYTASCHKWLSAPFGSGFLYVRRRAQSAVQPVVVSWGGSIGGRPASWRDEFHWLGTRDPAPFLAIPTALDFLETIGWQRFRDRVHSLACYARDRITPITGLDPIIPEDRRWFGSMIALPVDPGRGNPTGHGRRDPLQDALWNRCRIEIPVVWWQGLRMVRVSCHLYTQTGELDLLADALRELLPLTTE
ncbi:MAG TPA: aminotransferase class V-fold PLP-dependent enzyme [Planctomycetaceae bacterium]|nr:aminotransferase class V-fold PLP-dependent enzyme [Planctomycetaceae bacterium]